MHVPQEMTLGCRLVMPWLQSAPFDTSRYARANLPLFQGEWRLKLKQCVQS